MLELKDSEDKLVTGNDWCSKIKVWCLTIRKVPKRFIIPYRNKKKKIWDMIVILFAIYNSFAVPLEISMDFDW